MGGACSTNGEKRNAYRLLVGKPKGRRPLGRPIRTWLDNIRTDLVEVEWGDVDCIGLAQNRDRWRALVNSVLNLRVTSNACKLSCVQTTRDTSSSRVGLSSMELVIITQSRNLISVSRFKKKICFSQNYWRFGTSSIGWYSKI
jgi:hypothetical protein